jgi:hypothetical protein
LLLGTRTRKDIEPIVRTFMTGAKTQGGRLLVAAWLWTYLVEVYRARYRIRELFGDAVITNTFSLITEPPEQPQDRIRSSAVRAATAERMLAEIRHLDGLKAMLRSHEPDKGNDSICNHRPNGGGTESSHIIQVCAQSARWWHLAGFPCEHNYRVERLFRAHWLGGRTVPGSSAELHSDLTGGG